MTSEKFYYIRNGQQVGPFEAEQLSQENITPQTMVWRQGLEDWKEARLLPELDFLWQNQSSQEQVPPYNGFQTPLYGGGFFPGVDPNAAYRPCPPTYLAWSIIVTLICCWPLGIPAIINASKVEKAHMRGDFLAAEKHSKAAKSWSIASAILGALFGICYVVFMFILGIAESY